MDYIEKNQTILDEWRADYVRKNQHLYPEYINPRKI